MSPCLAASRSEEINYTSRYLPAHQRGLPANAVCLAPVTTSLLTFIHVIFAAIPASGELPPAPFYKRVQACGAQELGQRKGACCLNQHVSRAEHSDFGWEMQALNISVPAASQPSRNSGTAGRWGDGLAPRTAWLGTFCS